MVELGNEVAYREVDTEELEQLIVDHYDLKHYNICTDQESHNGARIAIDVSCKKNHTGWDRDTILNLRATRYVEGHSLWAIMQDLVNDGVIPPARYLIHIS